VTIWFRQVATTARACTGRGATAGVSSRGGSGSGSGFGGSIASDCCSGSGSSFSNLLDRLGGRIDLPLLRLELDHDHVGADFAAKPILFAGERNQLYLLLRAAAYLPHIRFTAGTSPRGRW
jgi:hypothetical protein